MIASIQQDQTIYQIDLGSPIDISLPLKASTENPSAWYLEAPKIEPVVLGDWIGSVAQGSATNFNSIWFSPHAHGTHTECVGHITKDFYSINEQLQTFFFTAELISIQPQKVGEDYIITKNQLEQVIRHSPQAVVIRTLPNTENKKTQKYSNSNPPYLEEQAAVFLREIGIKHLLIDLPSIDKEKDEGKLVCHHAFWDTKGTIRLDATITELVYVPEAVADGFYLLNLQIAPFHNDATPSKPILYSILN